jgi:23S rRNA pseudouridine2605 synthase
VTTGERLQKVLAQLGLGSRREIEDWIRLGRLRVNGQPASLGVRVAAGDVILLDGRPVRQRPAKQQHQVFMCHRSPGEDLRDPTGRALSAGDSAGAVSASSAHAEAENEARDEPRRSMAARLPRRAGRRFFTVSPMPRVDGGLELLTADGELALRLQRSVRSQEVAFSARVKGLLGPDQTRGIESGQLDKSTPVTVLVLETDEVADPEDRAANTWYRIRTRGASGKEVRQLFERQGVVVSRILRTAFGPLELDRTLARGQFRALETAELEALGLAAPAAPERARPRAPKRAARRSSDRSRRG